MPPVQRVRRSVSILLLLFLATGFGSQAFVAVAQGQRPSLDIQLPDYPVDEAACAAFLKGGHNSLSPNPFGMKGVSHQDGQQFYASLFPASPVFAFYARMQEQFSKAPPAFAPGMRCFLNATQAQDDLFHFVNLPDGGYATLIYITHSSTEMGIRKSRTEGYDAFGPTVSTTSTPYTFQRSYTEIYSQPIELLGGKVVETGTLEKVH